MKKKITHILILFSILIALFACLLGWLVLSGKICPHPEFMAETVTADCIHGGGIRYICKICNYKFEEISTPPTGHKLDKMVVSPTCSAEGYTIFYCNCGYNYRSEYTTPTKHQLKKEDYLPTCTEQGYTKYSCTSCSYSFASNYLPPLGHKFKETVVLPTAKEAGYTDYICDCEYKYRGNYIYYSDILESAYTKNTHVLARGIDVSRWNHMIDTATGDYLPLDWKLIKKAGYDFVILKAGSTKSGIEPTFSMDYRDAKAAGLDVGVYYYTYASTISEISKDAELLKALLKEKKFEYPIYLDIEDSSLSSLGKNYLSAMCEEFLCSLQKSGYYVGLYTNHAWLTTILDTARIVTLFDIWYARYPLSEKPTWNEEKYGKQLGMWQFSESGKISGINGSFDFNYSYKDYTSLMKKWHLNGY